MTYEDEGGHPINQDVAVDDATQRVEAVLESQADTIRDLLENLEMLLVVWNDPWHKQAGTVYGEAKAAIKRTKGKDSA